MTQPDHARLAGRLMRAWRADGFLESAAREAILLATRAHDDGWSDEDRAPIVDSTGRVLDFVNAPVGVRQRVWPRSVQRLSSAPYAAALVAEHALTIAASNRSSPAWAEFFRALEGLRSQHLAACRGATEEDLSRDYFFVSIGDLMSLVWCNGWTERYSLGRYEVWLEASRLRVRPDPFGGREVTCRVRGRQLPNRCFDRPTARRLFEAAPLVTLPVVAVGS